MSKSIQLPSQSQHVILPVRRAGDGIRESSYPISQNDYKADVILSLTKDLG